PEPGPTDFEASRADKNAWVTNGLYRSKTPALCSSTGAGGAAASRAARSLPGLAQTSHCAASISRIDCAAWTVWAGGIAGIQNKPKASLAMPAHAIAVTFLGGGHGWLEAEKPLPKTALQRGVKFRALVGQKLHRAGLILDQF